MARRFPLLGKTVALGAVLLVLVIALQAVSGMVEERPRHRLFDEESVQESLFGDTEDEYVLSSVLCGEEYAVQDVPHPKDDFVSARDISVGLEVRKLDELWHFLEVFNGNRKSIWLRAFSNAIRPDKLP